MSVGKRSPRIDAVEKLTGRAKYTGDISLPGLLFGKLLRSPHAHAKISKIDVSKAERIRGVKAVLTFKDIPRIPFCGSCWEFPYGVEDRYVLDNRVRFVGEAIAAVAAESEQIADEALQQIEVEYELLPAVFDPVKALLPNAPKIHDVERNIPRGKPLVIKIGDVRKGFEKADHVFDDTYSTSSVKQCNLEPCACIAKWDSTGNLTVWSSTQIPFLIQRVLSKVLQMPLNKVRIIQPYLGGGFGNKADVTNEHICAFLARKARGPVRIVHKREEEFFGTKRRHPTIMRLKTGVDEDGALTAREAKCIVDTGAYTSHTDGVAGNMAYSFVSLYKCDNIGFESYSVYTNTPCCGAFRGFGDPQIHFAVESQIDDIAQKLRMDPIDLRINNLVRAGDIDRSTGWTFATCGIQKCIEEGMARIGWKKSKSRRTNGLGSTRRGLGMAVSRHVSGVRPHIPDSSSAFIRLNEDGTVNLLTGACEMGQGIKTTLAQIAAEVLGLEVDCISVSEADTAFVPYDPGAYGSRSTYIAGGAVKAAAEDAKEELLTEAAKILKTNPKELDIKAGLVYYKALPKKGVPISNILKSAHREILGKAVHEPSTNAPSFGAHFTEVEVDTETGIVRVLKIVAAHDAGRVINPLTVEGQIEGGVHMGLGYALCEELLLDQKTGETLTPNFTDYKLLTPCDMPKVETILIETEEPTGPFGAKGLGENTCIPTAPAVANAIYNAIGVRIRELPITPEKVLQELEGTK